jgi:mRNA interferase HigB
MLYKVEIVGLSELVATASRHADVQKAVNAWIAIVLSAEWQSLIDVKNTYSRSADYVNGRTVFNLRGNNYRLRSLTTIYKLWFLKPYLLTLNTIDTASTDFNFNIAG